jgi:hypothetical protein
MNKWLVGITKSWKASAKDIASCSALFGENVLYHLVYAKLISAEARLSEVQQLCRILPGGRPYRSFHCTASRN